MTIGRPGKSKAMNEKNTLLETGSGASVRYGAVPGRRRRPGGRRRQRNLRPRPVPDARLACTGQGSHRRAGRAPPGVANVAPGRMSARWTLLAWSMEWVSTRNSFPSPIQLRLVQLRIIDRLTKESAFAQIGDRYQGYTPSRAKPNRALCHSCAFPLCHS
jgi:hypothetical protein